MSVQAAKAVEYLLSEYDNIIGTRQCSLETSMEITSELLEQLGGRLLQLRSDWRLAHADETMQLQGAETASGA